MTRPEHASTTIDAHCRGSTWSSASSPAWSIILTVTTSLPVAWSLCNVARSSTSTACRSPFPACTLTALLEQQGKATRNQKNHQDGFDETLWKQRRHLSDNPADCEPRGARDQSNSKAYGQRLERYQRI